MYDRVNLALHVPDPRAVLDRLHVEATDTRAKDPLPTYRGHLGPFRFALRGDRLGLRGSLARFVGLGVAPHCVGALAVPALECAIGVPVGSASVGRLEVFADLRLSEPCACYLPLFLDLARHTPAWRRGRLIKFETVKRGLLFYDKAAELRVPVSGGLMRVELDWARGGLSKDFGRPVQLADLAQPEFGEWAAGEWARYYRAVVKGRELSLTVSTRHFSAQLQAIGLETLGVPNVLAQIKASRRAGHTSSSTASDWRRKVLKLATDPRFTHPSERIAEVDEAVADAFERMKGERTFP